MLVIIHSREGFNFSAQWQTSFIKHNYLQPRFHLKYEPSPHVQKTLKVLGIFFLTTYSPNFISVPFSFLAETKNYFFETKLLLKE